MKQYNVASAAPVKPGPRSSQLRDHGSGRAVAALSQFWTMLKGECELRPDRAFVRFSAEGAYRRIANRTTPCRLGRLAQI